MAGRAGDGEIGECPPPDTVYAYANSLQRTVPLHSSLLPAHSPGVIFLFITGKNGHYGPNL